MATMVGRWRHASFPRLVAAASLAVSLIAVDAAAAAEGAELWVKRYNGPENGFDSTGGVTVSPDGTMVYVTGQSASVSGSDYATIAYDSATGTQVWARRFDGPMGDSDEADALVVSPNGSAVFVTGTSRTATDDQDFGTIAYDANTGRRLWRRFFDGPATANSFDRGASIGVAPDGSAVFVTGPSASDSTASDIETLAYDASTGQRLWAKRFVGRGLDISFALAVAPGGSSLFVTGSSDKPSTGASTYITLAYDAATGTNLWTKRHDGPDIGNGAAHDVVTSVDGQTVFVTGGLDRGSGNSDLVTIAYDAATGGKRWARRYDGPVHGHDEGMGLAADPTGNRLIATGRSAGTGDDADYATVSYDATSGARLWMRRYAGPADGFDAATSIGTSADGLKVFVTGESAGPNGPDFGTVAYDAGSGAKLWGRRYNGPARGDDYVVSLATAPYGTRVYVTGTSAGIGTDVDYATIAYDS
jgi:hypothetical protein